MSGICSRHQHTEPGCHACHTTPAQVLGVTEAEWDRIKALAEASGSAKCQHCGFEQYRNHARCLLCGSGEWEGQAITDEINADPEEVDRLSKSRQQAREGKTIPLSELEGDVPNRC